MLKCFYDYRFPAEMSKAFDGADRFYPVTYQKDWAIVRQVAESGGELQPRRLRPRNRQEQEVSRMSTSLRISGLVKEYRAGRPVLNGIDLEVAGQGLTAIIGPSGTGKSTLLRCINRLIEPTRGEITLRSGQDSVDLARVRGPAPRAPPHRHGVPGIQPGRAPDGHGEPADRPARLHLGLQCLDPPLRARGHRARLPAAGHRGLAGFADQRADALSAASASAWASPAR